MTEDSALAAVLPAGWASRDAIRLTEVADVTGLARHSMWDVATAGYVNALPQRGIGRAFLVEPREAARLILAIGVAAALGIALSTLMRAMAERPEMLGEAGQALAVLSATAAKAA